MLREQFSSSGPNLLCRLNASTKGSSVADIIELFSRCLLVELTVCGWRNVGRPAPMATSAPPPPDMAFLFVLSTFKWAAAACSSPKCDRLWL